MAVLSLTTNTCKACKQELPIDQFHKHWKASQNRFFCDNVCKACVATVRTNTVLTHAEKQAKKLKFREYAKVHRAKRKKNPAKMDRHRAYEREYRRKMRHTGMFLRNSPRELLDKRMSTLIRESLKHTKAGERWQDIVGFSLEQLTVHIEKQFSHGMSWANISDWHIDHRLPRSSFEYQGKNDEEFKACWALTNLQPMWSLENISKGNKRIYLI